MKILWGSLQIFKTSLLITGMVSAQFLWHQGSLLFSAGPYSWKGFPAGSDGKESACKAGDLGLIPGLGKFLEKGMPIQSSILACRIPWTEEPGGLQSMGSPRVRHDWVTNIFIFQDQKTSKWMKYITCGQRGEEQSLWSLQFLCTNY